MTTAAPETLSDLPLDTRRHIMIISDQDFDKRRNAGEDQESDKPLNTGESNGSSGSALAAIGLIASSVVPGGVIARVALAAGSVAYAAYTADSAKNSQSSSAAMPRTNDAVHIADSAKNSQSSTVAMPRTNDVMYIADGAKDSQICTVAMRHTNELKFRPGAQVGQGYAVNPVSDKLYYPISSYYDDLMDHKISELELLLNTLGAKHYRIIYQETDSAHSNSSGKVGRLATASVDVELTNSRKRRFERSGKSEGREPALPDILEWFDGEPSWKSLAESRMFHGRKEFTFIFELEQTFGLSAKVVAGFKSMGVEFAAGHDRNTNLVLSVTGSF